MATKIVTKNSSTASAVPTASDLVQGELAVNVADKRLFTEDNGGSIVELGTNPSTIDINAGSIDGTAIGASSASTGAFTTLTASGLTVDTNTLHVDSTNNRVGIGTTSPSRTLHLKEAVPSIRLEDTDVSGVYHEMLSEANTGYCIRVDEGNVSSGSYFRVEIDNSEKMRIDSSGQVGIGTSSPSSKLHSSGDGDSASKLTVQRTGATTGTVWLGYNYVGSASNNDFKFITNSTERMRIDSSGNVGIGTTSPASTLEIAKNDQTNGATLSITNSFNGGSWNAGDIVGSIDFRTDDTSTTEPVRGQIKVFDDASGGANTYPYASAMSFTTTLSDTSTERMRINSSGNLNIYGTDNRPLAITSFATASAGAGWDLDATSGNGVVTVSTGGTERMRIDSFGSVMVGRTSSSASDEDNGVVLSPSGYAYLARTGTSNQIHVSFINNAAVSSATVGTIKTSGSSTSYNTSSDQRLKENIADADDAGSKIDAIQVRKFDWKVDGSHQDYGMIAQELVEVAPEAVDVPEDSEEMMAVDYSKLVPMLIKEIQSLRNRVAQLEE